MLMEISIIIYLIIYFLVIIMLKNKKPNKIKVVILAILLGFFAGMRYKVGTDFSAYVYLYKDNVDLNFFDW